jgi:hypothetical protein
MSPFGSTARAFALVSGLIAPLAVLAGKLDLSTPEGALAAQRKIQCSLVDGVPITYWWLGDMYSRVPGERDRLLFKVEGMNVRQCGTLESAQQGKGFRLVSREILLYKDPQSGEIVREWKNPWTGETVKVLHVANDPVNGRGTFPQGADGKPMKFEGTLSGGRWWLTSTIPLFYENPLAGEYQKYVGGMYQATELFNFFGEVADLVDDKKPSAEVSVGWSRISGWLPWMQMGGRAGAVYFHTAGRKLARWDDLSETMKTEIRTSYPEWVGPPPLDDARPNETSWTYFKKKVPPEPPRR